MNKVAFEKARGKVEEKLKVLFGLKTFTTSQYKEIASDLLTMKGEGWAVDVVTPSKKTKSKKRIK